MQQLHHHVAWFCEARARAGALKHVRLQGAHGFGGHGLNEVGWAWRMSSITCGGAGGLAFLLSLRTCGRFPHRCLHVHVPGRQVANWDLRAMVEYR